MACKENLGATNSTKYFYVVKIKCYGSGAIINLNWSWQSKREPSQCPENMLLELGGDDLLSWKTIPEFWQLQSNWPRSMPTLQVLFYKRLLIAFLSQTIILIHNFFFFNGQLLCHQGWWRLVLDRDECDEVNKLPHRKDANGMLGNHNHMPPPPGQAAFSHCCSSRLLNSKYKYQHLLQASLLPVVEAVLRYLLLLWLYMHFIYLFFIPIYGLYHGFQTGVFSEYGPVHNKAIR